MPEEKLSCDEVPQKLTEWLLNIGCPPEKVPSIDKMTQMCRGQYYMVWRSMMERVKPKDIIKERRLQVFCNDVENYENRNVFSERGNNKVVPEEILLLKRQKELQEKVRDAEQSIETRKQSLHVLMDEIKRKVSKRNASRQALQDLQRRVFQLTLAAEDWENKKTNLEQTKTIAESLCNIKQNDEDLKAKLDKCLPVFARPPSSAGASTSQFASDPLACSSVVSSTPSDHTDEELIESLVRCGPGLWTELYERRAACTQALLAANTLPEVAKKNNCLTPQWVISQTIALQLTLALEAMKNKVHISNSRKKLANAVSGLNKYLTTEEATELLVLKCERACAEARVVSLREILEEMTSRRGHFLCEGREEAMAPGQIAQIDKSIAVKKEELKRLMGSLSMTDRKILNVRECLLSVFNAFYKDTLNHEIYKGVQLDLPQESIADIRRFYEERRQSTTKMELSMNLDVSNISNDTIDLKNPRLLDELKIYLKKFNLEKNRKLVLETGEKIWIFEALASSLSRLHTIQQKDSFPPLLNPLANVAYCILKLKEEIMDKAELEKIQRKISTVRKAPMPIDIQTHQQKEEKIHDKMMKFLNDNILTLQKTNRTLEVGLENLEFWESNYMRKYISNDRKIDGKSYKDYEAICLENLY